MKSNNEGGSARTSVGSVGVTNLPGKFEIIIYRRINWVDFMSKQIMHSYNKCRNLFFQSMDKLFKISLHSNCPISPNENMVQFQKR